MSGAAYACALKHSRCSFSSAPIVIDHILRTGPSIFRRVRVWVANRFAFEAPWRPVEDGANCMQQLMRSVALSFL
jgi:hypothetical protein